MELKLGKKKYEHDERTLMMTKYITDLWAPSRWDFDAGRNKFISRMWANDDWGDCVIAGRANQQVRLERMEQRRTIIITDQDVISSYQNLSGAVEPGDKNDIGIEVIDGMRDWRNNGWNLGRHNYKITAYGELDPGNFQSLCAATYHLCGVHLGFWLPKSAEQMLDEGVWDYAGQNGPNWKPGSWGGHLTYCKKYDGSNLYVLTWGMQIRVTQRFLDRYCDEAWAVVDSADSWRSKNSIDVDKLMNDLQAISTKINR